MNDRWQDLYDEGITAGEGSIVAVIDTGVDYTHNDLAANMWINTVEFNGKAGVDDDGNGYVDDIYGASTVGAKYYHSGDPMDDHGHGTHVAGIVAMTANNDEGGVGVSYGTKIMAIKAGQATGVFSDTDIAEAINYAAAMGADVINMSFGGTGRSFLVEEALANAFGSCILVAAAGNNGLPTTDAMSAGFNLAIDCFPAGYSYVLGVMATDKSGNLASFSNWDFVDNGGSAEYELTAPGVDIYSTLPGNQYAAWDGTSMAAPMVSAAAALIRSYYSDTTKYSSRFIMGQLASATDEVTNYVDKKGLVHLYN
jgi:subtilisin family serine protease